MKTYIVDTNFLLRFLLRDDPIQSPIAHRYFADTNNTLILSMVTLCEAVWVMKKRIKLRNPVIVTVLQGLAKQSHIKFDRTIFEIGIAFLQAGGDFADGVIAYQVSQFDHAHLLTFDKDAQKIAKNLTIAVEALAN